MFLFYSRLENITILPLVQTSPVQKSLFHLLLVCVTCDIHVQMSTMHLQCVLVTIITECSHCVFKGMNSDQHRVANSTCVCGTQVEIEQHA